MEGFGQRWPVLHARMEEEGKKRIGIRGRREQHTIWIQTNQAKWRMARNFVSTSEVSHICKMFFHLNRIYYSTLHIQFLGIQ
jgi:hypothetical protein